MYESFKDLIFKTEISMPTIEYRVFIRDARNHLSIY